VPTCRFERDAAGLRGGDTPTCGAGTSNRCTSKVVPIPGSIHILVAIRVTVGGPL
jgi:hypothetical protein